MKSTSKLFSFKKFIAVDLSFAMFLQCPSLSFASDDVQLIENSNQRIATQHKNGKYYVATFDKNTKILVQNTYVDGTNELIDTVKCDLNIKPENNVILKGCSCNTACGFSYYDDKDINCSKKIILK